MRFTRVLALVLVVAPCSARADEQVLTCDSSRIDARSWRLATEGQARLLLEPDWEWWMAFQLGRHEVEALGLAESSAAAAAKAAELDPGNLVAHGLLARQYLVLGDERRAGEEWRRVLDAGAPVVWLAILHDVDAHDYFALAFDRETLRIYRFGQLAGAIARGAGDLPQFPPAERTAFWAAMGGCLDAEVEPVATIPWSAVRRMRAGNYVVWFDLDREVRLRSDRGEEESEDELKVGLLGPTGTLEAYNPAGEREIAIGGRGPAWFQAAFRRTLLAEVDPRGRIEMPKQKVGAGW